METQKQTQRTLIIGDIHGCYDELLELLDVAAVGADDLVVSVGDLVDRGPKPAEVVRWFRERATQSKSIVIMGNHERKHVRGVFSYSQDITKIQFGEHYTEAVEWMRGLPYFYETPEVRVVHAAMKPGVPLAEHAETILCGSASGEAQLRAAFPDGWWHERYDDDVPIVFGHHVTGAEPIVREGKVYGIDTGACHGLRLTALSIPDFKLYSVPSRADYWKITASDYQVPVLRGRSWPTMSWAKLEENLNEHRPHANDEAATYLASVATWANDVRASIPKLLDRVGPILEELRAKHNGDGDALTKAMQTHAVKPLLYLQAKKKLTLDAVMLRCTTPKATIDLAAKLGVTIAPLD